MHGKKEKVTLCHCPDNWSKEGLLPKRLLMMTMFTTCTGTRLCAAWASVEQENRGETYCSELDCPVTRATHFSLSVTRVHDLLELY